MPIEEDIGIAYQSYYTHGNVGADRRSFFTLTRSILLRITGVIREHRMVKMRFLGDVKPGHLLDVGCGGGVFLHLMQKRGWDVDGVDVDPTACRYASNTYGLTVHNGNLFSANFPDDTFDAIVLSHIIEHVYDPVALLAECRRIIKASSPIVLITPNIESWGHLKYKKNWRGLEPPRHIMVHSMNSLRKCAEASNLDNIKLSTTPAGCEYILRKSFDCKQEEDCGRYAAQDVGLRFFLKRLHILNEEFYEYKKWKVDKNIGEEIVMICSK